MFKIKVLNSNTTRPVCVNLTKMHDIYHMPKCFRRFESKKNYIEHITNENNADSLCKEANDVRYLAYDIKLQLDVYVDETCLLENISFVIKKGLIYDGGSLPFGMQWMVKRASKLGYAVHDNEYKFQELSNLINDKMKAIKHSQTQKYNDRFNYYSQLIADQLMTATHQYRGLSLPRRAIVYGALRFFGKHAFKKHRKCPL